MTTVFLAGGGTGGHVFPMVAVARQMLELNPEVKPIFVGTARGMESEFVPKQGFQLELLEVLPIRGGGIKGALRGSLRALRLLPECRALLKEYKPKAVFSAGGYAAGPVSLAARTMGIPVGLMEPNSAIGLANHLMAPLVQRAYTGFARVERHFSPEAVRALGVPIRNGFTPSEPRSAGPSLRILVLGGSQGAQALNESLPKAFRALGSQIAVTHQCGRKHIDSVTQTYRDLGMSHVEVTSFIEDMPAALSHADLVVSRSGASAVSEVIAVGRASLLIPYPYASGNHQYLNAKALEAEGAALTIKNADATSEHLEVQLKQLIENVGKIPEMSRNAARIGQPFAARNIAQDFLELAGIPIQVHKEASVTPLAE